MNDEERLAHLDEAWERKSSDYEWLLRQARLAREYAEIIDSQNESLTTLLNENKRLREALKFYVDKNNYSKGMFPQTVLLDNGTIAEKALKG